jgi:hypothetical protein
MILMVRLPSKESVGDWLAEWYPVLIPLLLLVGRILVTARLGAYNGSVFPSDLCYYGTTFYIWALTTKLNGHEVSLRPMGEGEWYFVILFLVVNFILYIFLYPVDASGSKGRLLLSIVVAFLFGLGSPIYLRARF